MQRPSFESGPLLFVESLWKEDVELDDEISSLPGRVRQEALACQSFCQTRSHHFVKGQDQLFAIQALQREHSSNQCLHQAEISLSGCWSALLGSQHDFSSTDLVDKIVLVTLVKRMWFLLNDDDNVSRRGIRRLVALVAIVNQAVRVKRGQIECRGRTET